MRISATDIDNGNNSVVHYTLKSGSLDDSYFRIDKSTGVIYLQKPIDKSPGYKFRLMAKAEDQGETPLSNQIELEIQVVESNKKSPSFIGSPYEPVSMPEDFKNFADPIITIQAVSNILEPDLLFELVTGRTEQTNKLNNFRLESAGNKAHIILAKPLDYESIAEYTLTVRAQNAHNLAAETQIQVHVTDVNDNIPYFTEVVAGSVSENEPPGSPVMQVKAIDRDATSAHNIVTYTLEDHLDLFTIDRNTGNITTLREFDREDKEAYNVKIRANDNSPSALLPGGDRYHFGEQTFRIEISDKNDNPPYFTKEVFVADAISEDANVNALVTEIEAKDQDTASIIEYSITGGNTYDAFSIEKTTGKIRIKNKLDYENITEYTLNVRAFDGIYEARAKVEIKIENVNDNPPQFTKQNITVSILEETLPEGCIAYVEAYDPDIPNRNAPQGIVYSIVKEEQRKLLSIDESGCLRLIKPLDRDPPNGFPRWQVIVSAVDENGGPGGVSNSTEVIIELEDINDNAPYLSNIQPVVWYENEPPNRPIVLLTAKDNDSDINGPPFQFDLDFRASDDVKMKFEIRGKYLYPLVTFDREEIKDYFIDISITDNGTPTMTGVSILHVVIGDVNDNKMQPGESSIFVYNYKGESPNTDIGRVYVNDPDDWDLPDKRFEWLDGLVDPKFILDSDTGMITMRQGTQDGIYRLNFKVTEESLLIERHSVDASVTITVKEIPEEAVDKSGSVRLLGITAEQFIQSNHFAEPSLKDKFRLKLATLLNTSYENVDLFTVLHHNDNTSLLDVRFSAHGSPYYAPEKINTKVGMSYKEIEEELGLNIFMINIDECMEEKVNCESSCTNHLEKSTTPYVVYTNKTSFVGVSAIVRADCTCAAPPLVICQNGGTPFDNFCECPEGFEGPACEIISVGFTGDGWALYPSLSACESSHISLEVNPYQEEGLILFAGPMHHNSLFAVQDFVALELHEGYPVLLVDYGTGSVRVVHRHIKLTDGASHRIDITLQKSLIEMTVDNCKLSSCMTIAAPQGPNEILNVNAPLQIGGSPTNFNSLGAFYNWTYHPTNIGFTGCIKNFTFNGQTYNLGMPSLAHNADAGCQRSFAKAVSFGIDTNFLVAILVCIAILVILLLAVVVHRRKQDGWHEKILDDIRENIINYEDEGGGEVDTGYDLNVLRTLYDEYPLEKERLDDGLQNKASSEVPDICGFLDDKKEACDKDTEINPFDDVRHYAYEGDGNTSGSLSSLASCTDDGDLKFNYLSHFGPRFRKLADMYGEEPSDTDSQDGAEESWC
ncbi:LOW QUALITY PROTEIN: DE-cadherin-like [Ctenocephalides felis]|uniref:LOW QUALITY PROTEIN: DE-cadherin-like n=1 Tax=Ctenocephalides felis TaxID=7515 RepID=UPI000E6E1C84|nr:LOW QUALITY PROTEIN: DE-cadherin-like [Ctenocephalides felis]